MTDSPRDIATLVSIMARLRDPKDGCPWDLAQSFSSIAPYTIEEAYEVAGAIGDEDWAALKEELGDLLFQAVFHARMAEELGVFRFADIVVLAQKFPNKDSKRPDILVHSIKFLRRILAGYTGKAGTWCIHEHKIGGIKQALTIVHHPIWRGWGMCVVSCNNPYRSKCTHMQPNAG